VPNAVLILDKSGTSCSSANAETPIGKKTTTSKRHVLHLIIKHHELTDLARALITMAILNKHVVDIFTN